MPSTRIGTELFRTEAERRLIDSFELMLLCGVRSKQAVWKRVETGQLPRPVISKASVISLWDRDEVATYLGE